MSPIEAWAGGDGKARAGWASVTVVCCKGGEALDGLVGRAALVGVDDGSRVDEGARVAGKGLWVMEIGAGVDRTGVADGGMVVAEGRTGVALTTAPAIGG